MLPDPAVHEEVALGLFAWQDLIRQRIVALDIRPGDTASVRGRVSTHRVGPLWVASVESVGQTLRRTPKLIERHGEDWLQVALMHEGEALLEQDGRSARIRPGSFVVYDTSRPFTWTMPGPWRMHVFTWSRDDMLLDANLPTMTARPVDGGATGLVARAALGQLADLPGSVGGGEGVELAAQVCELILTAVAQQIPLFGPVSPATTLGQVLEFVELRLTDPELSPATIAAGCHISVRTLHRLFADQPRSLSRWIRFRRLERARVELAAHPQRPIAVVAAQAHFSDATAFARAFRDEYGLSPREFRLAYRVESRARVAPPPT